MHKYEIFQQLSAINSRVFQSKKEFSASTISCCFSTFLLPILPPLLSSPVPQHEPVVTSKIISVPGGSVFVNPTTTDKDNEEVERYVTVATNGKPPATGSMEGGIGGLEKEVEAILTKSGSLVEAESHIQ